MVDRDTALSESANEESGPEQEASSNLADSDTSCPDDDATLEISASLRRSSSSPVPFLSFREPAKNIKELRQLALQGREETLREEAEGREKVVWGSVDDAQSGQEERDSVGLGGGTPPAGAEVVDLSGECT